MGTQLTNLPIRQYKHSVFYTIEHYWDREIWPFRILYLELRFLFNKDLLRIIISTTEAEYRYILRFLSENGQIAWLIRQVFIYIDGVMVSQKIARRIILAYISACSSIWLPTLKGFSHLLYIQKFMSRKLDSMMN